MLWLGYIVYLGGIFAIVYSFSLDGAVGWKILLLIIWLFLGGFILGERSKRAFAKLDEKLEYSKKRRAEEIVDAKVKKTAFVRILAKTLDVNAGYATHYVSFEFPDGARKNFQVNVEQYNSVVENETGTLTYKGFEKHLIFVNFQCQI